MYENADRQPPAKVIGYFSIVPITFRLVTAALFYLHSPASVSVFGLEVPLVQHRGCVAAAIHPSLFSLILRD